MEHNDLGPIIRMESFDWFLRYAVDRKSDVVRGPVFDAHSQTIVGDLYAAGIAYIQTKALIRLEVRLEFSR